MSAKRSFDYFRGADADSQEDDGGSSDGYDSEQFERSRASSHRGAKLRRASQPEEIARSESEDNDNSEDELVGQSDIAKPYQNQIEQPTEHQPEIVDDDKDLGSDRARNSTDAPPFRRKLQPVSQPLGKALLHGSRDRKRGDKKHKPGIIYLSRIPPYLTPSYLRTLLTPCGELNRIFLTPESEKQHALRRRHGGNKKQNFVDGWVEFVHKKDAKAAVELLNNHNIGGKKGGWYRDDIWSMRYLHGFNWDDLMEQRAAETKEREGRMRAETAQVIRENKRFLNNVKHARTIEAIQEKRRTRLEANSLSTNNNTESAKASDAQTENSKINGNEDTNVLQKPLLSKVSKTGPQYYFRQTQVHRTPDELMLKHNGTVKHDDSAEQVQRVLSKIF